MDTRQGGGAGTSKPASEEDEAAFEIKTDEDERRAGAAADPTPLLPPD